MRSPKAFAGGLRPVEGGEWIAGETRWRDNPRHVIPPAFFHVVRLWLQCRGEGAGLATLPEPGGLNSQPAWLLAAFDVLAAAAERARPKEGAG